MKVRSYLLEIIRSTKNQKQRERCLKILEQLKLEYLNDVARWRQSPGFRKDSK